MDIRQARKALGQAKCDPRTFFFRQLECFFEKGFGRLHNSDGTRTQPWSAREVAKRLSQGKIATLHGTLS